jgi:dipeptidyl aminopeptidase/acylaminoacyl peptidase
MRRLPAWLATVGSALACVPCPACQHSPNTVVAVAVPAWHEDSASAFTVSPDGRWALLAGRSGAALADLARRQIDTIVAGAAGRAALRARLGSVEPAWSALEPRPAAVPDSATLERSPDGRRLAFLSANQDTVFVGPADTLQPYVLDGTVTGMGWVPHGDLLYVLVRHPDGLSSLDRINVETGAIQPIRPQLDAPPGGGGVAVSADARTLYVALASDTTSAAAARQPPGAGRDRDIYALDLRSGRLSRVAATPGDDVFPVLAGSVLYWTQNDAARHRKLLWRLRL